MSAESKRWPRWLVAVFLVLGSGPLLWLAIQPPSWVEHRSEGQYQVLFPEPPTLEVKQKPRKGGGQVEVRRASAEAFLTASSLSVTTLRYPEGWGKSFDKAGWLEKTRSKAEKSGAKILSLTSITEAGCVGQELRLLVEEKMLVLTRTFIKGDAMIQVRVVEAGQLDLSAESQRFLKSFRLE